MFLSIAAAWMIVVWPAMIVLCPQWLPSENKPSVGHDDFTQYYVGALVAKYGMWDSLYPVPKASVYEVPSTFKPQVKTFLFRPPPSISRDLTYYPDIKMGAENSDVSPQLAAAFPPSAGALRYIYPPPLALLLRPLASVPFDQAGLYIWPVLSVWSFFAALYLATRTMRYFCGGPSYLEVILLVAWLVFSWRGRMHLSQGNVSPMLTGLICLSIYGLVRARPASFCVAFIPLVLFKSLGISWLGLLLLERRYWNFLAILTVLVGLVNGVTILIEGFHPYVAFFALLPKIALPGGVGFEGTLLHMFGLHVQGFFTLANLGCIALLYYGFWKRLRRGLPAAGGQNYGLYVYALLAGTMATYCLLNFNFWIPYCPMYLSYPFLGWMLLEAWLASGTWRRVIVAGTTVTLVVQSTEWIVTGCLKHLVSPSAAGIYTHIIFPPFFIVLIPLFFLVVAFRRLFFGDDHAATQIRFPESPVDR